MPRSARSPSSGPRRRARHPRHDHDAGGPAGVLRAKADLREEIWATLTRAKVARFPGTQGRIPNFVGAEAAAEALRLTAEWHRARTIKANPDSPQWPVRERALLDGKTVFMAVPRLAEANPFFLLDPDQLSDAPRAAASIKGAARSARTVPLEDLKPVDLVVCGSVGAGEDGAQIGKGGGFSDLELALATEAGLIGRRTVVVTTVHELQVCPPGMIPTTEHDIRVDLVVTPERIVDCREGNRSSRRSARLHWDELTDEKIRAIPLLAQLRAQREERIASD